MSAFACSSSTVVSAAEAVVLLPRNKYAATHSPIITARISPRMVTLLIRPDPAFAPGGFAGVSGAGCCLLIDGHAEEASLLIRCDKRVPVVSRTLGKDSFF